MNSLKAVPIKEEYNEILQTIYKMLTFLPEIFCQKITCGLTDSFKNLWDKYSPLFWKLFVKLSTLLDVLPVHPWWEGQSS